MTRLTCTFIVLAAVGLLVSCAHPSRDTRGSELLTPIPTYGAAPLIRVKLAKATGLETVTVKTANAMLSIDGQRTEAPETLTLTRSGGLIDAGSLGTASSIEIEPRNAPAHFDIEDRIYRGKLRVVAVPEGWDIVNVVDLEQYVAGVIGWEMIASWPIEALKAQAVASRTYALFEMEQARGRSSNWDVDDTTMYQVYGGVGPADNPKQWRETANVLAARQATTGMVLTFNGQGFKAYFHSTSGGHTVDPMTAFGLEETITPLNGVELGGFDKDAPKHKWEVTMASYEVTARLIERSISPSDIIRIEAARTAPSGHAIDLKLFDRSGRHKVINAATVRHALGLFSTRFEAVKNGDQWVFTGSGYGHGCGMCQWSARGMARDGWDSGRILDAMYPGSELKVVY